MNIYPPPDTEGVVDIEAARRELSQSAMIRDEKLRRGAVAEITAAALLDIAASLRVVSAEARLAMPDPLDMITRPRAGDPDEREGDDEIDDPRDFLIAGDLVLADGHDEPAEVLKLGVSEGAVWAEVRFASGAETRLWADSLTRLVGDGGAGVELDIPTAADEAEAAPLAAAVELEDHTDEIDDDFVGDEHGEVASALDVLRANEAERKAKKKTAPKKGSSK